MNRKYSTDQLVEMQKTIEQTKLNEFIKLLKDFYPQVLKEWKAVCGNVLTFNSYKSWCETAFNIRHCVNVLAQANELTPEGVQYSRLLAQADLSKLLLLRFWVLDLTKGGRLEAIGEKQNCDHSERFLVYFHSANLINERMNANGFRRFNELLTINREQVN